MKILREVTVWDMDFQPNHDYLLNDQGHMVAYRKQHTSEWLFRKTPSKLFSKARRKFITLNEPLPINP